jgi:tripartite-type tricarboxylate transporter receptor subunit TctC
MSDKASHWRLTVAFAAAPLLAGLAIGAAQGQDAASFYKGKNVDLIIATPSGGGYDAYARVLARHIGNHIPGKPGIIAKNMPGASGTKALSFLFNIAPRDGATFGAIHGNNILEPMLALSHKRLDFDPLRFAYIGSANVETSLCILRAEAPVKSFRDAMTKQAVLGGSGTSTVFFPASSNAVLGTKFKIISGYGGTANLNLAMQRGEIDGFCGQFWSSLNTQNPEWITSGQYNIIVQEAAKSRAEIDRMGVPLVYDFVKSEADKQLLDLLYVPLTFGRPYVAPPDVPAERVQALRAAFDAALKDPALLEDAAKMRLPIEPMSGAELQALVVKLLATPPEIVKRLKDAMPNDE